MSHKIAKHIRAEIKYNPTDDKVSTRKYARSGKKGEAGYMSLECHPTTKRALYREMKKEMRNAK